MNVFALGTISILWCVFPLSWSLHHGPRTLQPPKPLYGLQALLDYTSINENRTFIHAFDSGDGFTFAYNVTLLPGIYNIDKDESIIHIDCNTTADYSIIELYSSDPVALAERINSSSFLVGDVSWGCVSGHFNDSRVEALYRRIDEVNIEEDVVFVSSAAIPLSHLFGESSIKLHIAPHYAKMQNKAAAATRDNMSPATTFDYYESWEYSYNYDTDNDRAVNRQITIPNSLGTAYCEECYYYFEPGLIFELEVLLGTYAWPYVNSLRMEFYGDSKLSAYIRIINPAQGLSEPVSLSSKVSLPYMVLPVGPIPLVIYPAFELLSQVEIVESTMELTMFGGFTATANVRYGIRYTASNENVDVVSENDWSFDGTPLSMENADKDGVLNPRLYLIPRLYLSPYGIVNFYIDVKPYVGVQLWKAGASQTTNAASGTMTVSGFNAQAKPSTPTAPVLQRINAVGVDVLLNPPASNLPITAYEVRYKCSNCYNYYFTDYLYPSSLGLFYKNNPFTCPTTSAYWSASLTSVVTNPDGSTSNVIGNSIMCADICAANVNCLMFSYKSSNTWCYIYTTTSLSYSSDSSCATWRKYMTGTTAKYYGIRNGDILGYTADGGSQTTQVITLSLGDYFTSSPYAYYVSHRALNGKGFSEWSAPVNVQISLTASSSVTSDSIYFTCSWSTNLKSGETLVVKVYEDDISGDDLITTVSVTTSGSSGSYQFAVGSKYLTPYYEEGNSQHLYCSIDYANLYPWVYSGNVAYYPVSNIVYSSTTSGSLKNVKYTFNTYPSQITKMEICFYPYSTSWTLTCMTYSPLSSFCTNNFCTISTGNTNIYRVFLNAYDSGNNKVELHSTYTSVNPTVHNISDIVKEVDEVAISSVHEQDIVSKHTEFVFSDMSVTSNLRVESPPSRRLTSTCPSSANGLNYEFYAGLALQVGMEEVSVPGYGLVVFEAMKSPQMNIINPTPFPSAFGRGCVEFPEMAPQIILKSPQSTDEWGQGTAFHTIEWDYWSIDDEDDVYVAFFDAQSLELVTYIVAPISAPVNFDFTADLFAVGKTYICSVLWTTNQDISSDAYVKIVSAAEDIGVGAATSFADESFDDDAVSFSGTLFEAGPITISLIDGTMCQAKFESFPMNTLCKLVISMDVSGESVYSMTINAGAEFEDISSLNTDGLVLEYGFEAPAFSFPGGSSASYFFERLGDVSMTSTSTFPGGEAMDMIKLNTGSVNEICLSSLVEKVADGSTDFASAAESVSQMITMLGVDACISANIVETETVGGGVKFTLTSEVKAFDDVDVDWTSFFDSVDNKAFQTFLLLSGAASEDMADQVFDELLNTLGIDGKISHSFDIGQQLVSLLSSTSEYSTASTLRFVDSSGSFQLGTYAVSGGSINPTPAPTVRPTPSTPKPTLYPTNAPSASPTVAPSSQPVANPTSSPTMFPSHKPTLSPTAAPTRPPSPIPSSQPNSTPLPTISFVPTTAPTQLPSRFPTSSPTVLPSLYPTTSPTRFPTLAPSLNPTTSSPTHSPTVRTKSTVVSFDADVDMENIGTTDFDAAAELSFRMVTAEAAGLNYESIIVTSVSDASSVSSHHRKLPSSAITIGYTLQAVMESVGYSDPDAMASSMQTSITDAYADPATSDQFVTTAVSLGSSTITPSTTVTISAPVFGSTTWETIDTPFPTSAPTFRKSSSSESTSDSSTYVIVGSVVGGALVVAILVAFIYYKTVWKSKVADVPVTTNTGMDDVFTANNPVFGVEIPELHRREPSSSAVAEAQKDIESEMASSSPVVTEAQKDIEREADEVHY